MNVFMCDCCHEVCGGPSAPLTLNGQSSEVCGNCQHALANEYRRLSLEAAVKTTADKLILS